MFADLRFLQILDDRDYVKEYRVFEGKNIQVVDSSWYRQPTEWRRVNPLPERPYPGRPIF